MFVHSQSIQHPASCSRSRFLQMLIVGIVTIVALCGGSASSIPVDGSRLVEEIKELEAGNNGAPHVQLLHWSHPESPVHVPGLSFAERFKYAVKASKERVAGLAAGQAASTMSSNVSFVDPLRNLHFEYGTVFTIGTPPRTFTGIADTGSDLVWTRCLPCPNCTNQLDPLFDPNESSTYGGVSCTDLLCTGSRRFTCQNKTCEFLYVYGGSAQGRVTSSGELSYETMTLTTTTGSTETAKKFVFGCAHATNGSFRQQDGLVGLGKGPLSFTTQLSSLYGNKFSYCLVSLSDSANKTSPLLFGDASIPKGAIQYTPFVTNPNASFFGAENFYYIGLKGIKVNGVDLDIPCDAFGFNDDGSGGVISDSGTTMTVLVDAAYDPLMNMTQSLINYPAASETNDLGLDLCYNVSGVSNPTFPNVTFVFDGMSLDLPQDNVFIAIPSADRRDKSTICMAISPTFSGIHYSNIFGNVQQQNFQYLYDRENNRFGFSPVQCDTLTAG